jgi:hypothetical protein
MVYHDLTARKTALQAIYYRFSMAPGVGSGLFPAPAKLFDPFAANGQALQIGQGFDARGELVGMAAEIEPGNASSSFVFLTQVLSTRPRRG